MKMLAGQIIAPRQIEMIEIPIPEAGEQQLVVKVEAGAICGSDLPYFLLDTSHPSLAGASPPLPPTLSLHELVGTVAQSRSRRFKEGDRVLALPYNHHGLAEYFLTEPDLVVPIPQGAAERLVLSQPLGTVVHACLKLPNLLGQTAVVLGQGPIGQLFCALLCRMGVLRVIAVDLLSERLEISCKMGATDIVCGDSTVVTEAVWMLTAGLGVDLVVEAVGTEGTLNLATRLVQRGGIVMAFGLPHRKQYDFAFNDFFYKEGRLINSVGPNVQRDFPIAVEMIAHNLIDVGPLVTHRLPLSRAQDGFLLFAERREAALKVVLTTG